ncbi:hypothetical protein CRUP_036740 [Coryphaenoides rupestris]|nr:hypothetical protein CRUP_036740 [Coryphaenoides rupestris]
MRYGELLSRFNDVHSEKKSIQEQFDSGCFDSIKLKEKLKLCNLKTKFEAKSKTQEECNKEELELSQNKIENDGLKKELKREMKTKVRAIGVFSIVLHLLIVLFAFPIRNIYRWSSVN